MHTVIMTLTLVMFPTQQNDAERIRSLRADDPVKALDLAQSLWSDEAHPEHQEIGLELVLGLAADGQHPRVLAMVDQLLPAVAGSPRLEGLLLIERIKAMIALRDWEGQSQVLAAVEELAPQIGQSELRSDVLSYAGQLLFHQAMFAEAESFFEKGLSALANETDPSHVHLLQNLGVVRAQQGKYPGAVSALLETVELEEKLGRRENVTVLKNLGALYFYMEDWEPSIEYTRRAIAGTDDPIDLASLYSNLGAAFTGLDRLDDAYAEYQKAHALSMEVGQPDATVLNNMGLVLLKWDRPSEALQHFSQALQIWQAEGAPEFEAIAKKNMGDAWVRMGDRTKAAVLLQESYDLYEKHDIRPKRIELYPVMIDNLEAMGNYQRALSLMREFKKMSDDMINVEAKASVAKLESAFELERKSRELAASERDRAVQDSAILRLQNERKLQRAIRVGLLFAVLTLGIVALLLIRSVRFRERANRVLSEQNAKIEHQSHQLLELNEELKRQSMEDLLTKLKNRRYLTEFMANESVKIARANKAGQGERLLLILADLDHFKRVNDTYGHPAGDHVLQVFADVLNSCGRGSDLIVRWGGEEFLWVCRDAAIGDGPELCERVHERLRDTPIKSGKDTIQVTCSLGFAPFPLWPDRYSPWEWTLKIADTALYEAKRCGRNGWVGFNPVGRPTQSPSTSLDMDQIIQDGVLTRLASPKFVVA